VEESGLFPDPTLRWRPYPSIIDGIERPPFVVDRGLWRGVLYLIVVAPKPSLRAYGIEMSCEIYVGFEEMIYSVADHGGKSDGGLYIKEAENSALLKAWSATDPVNRKPRRFSFVGGDYCYQTLGFSLSEPIIRAFDSRDQAYAWGLEVRLMVGFHQLRNNRPWMAFRLDARSFRCTGTVVPTEQITRLPAGAGRELGFFYDRITMNG
jgi:hypothetical protein